MKNVFLALGLMLFISSCKKDVDALPEATQTGANTFGARLNGEYWVPQRFTSVGTSTILEARLTGLGTLIINARNFSSSPTETEFELVVKNISGPGTYALNEVTSKQPGESASYGYYVKRRFTPEHEWITSPSHTGTITITRFDIPNKIVSGTFAFNAATIDGSADPITVTDGRFDVMLSN